jgi:hypothetical protein
MSRCRPRCLPALALAAVACASPGPRLSPDGSAPPVPGSSACRPPAGVSGAPRTISEVVALANALPRPLTLTCFLESLDRPLELHAALSTVSLQPAPSARSPRIFIFTGDVIMSVVPEGKGQSLLELGQLVALDRSAKAELKFPITEPLGADSPFAHVREEGGTTCRFCHPRETAAPALSPSAFTSGAFSPLQRARVDLEIVRAERQACDASAEPGRCGLLGALFDHGEVRPRDFPPGIPTAFDHP